MGAAFEAEGILRNLPDFGRAAIDQAAIGLIESWKPKALITAVMVARVGLPSGEKAR